LSKADSPLKLFLFPALLFALIIPHSAMAAYLTSLNVEVNDSSYHRPSPDFSETIEGELSASASVSYDNRIGYYGYPLAAISSASLDLWTGEIGFYIESMGYEASADASIQLTDTIYPVWNTGYSGVMEIQINWTVSGDYTPYSWNPNTQEWVIGGSPRNWGLSARFYHSVDGGTAVQSPYSQYNLVDGYERWTQTVFFDPDLNSSITISESVWGWLDSYNSQKLVADFSQTGLIELTLPEGASYTSDSGVFLRIPEPSSLILLALGGLALRKNKG